MISGNQKQIIKALNKAKTKQIVLGSTIENNRKILEHKNTKALILNHKLGKQMLYQQDSGLNQVLCKIAKNNNITLIIDLKDIQGDKQQKAVILAKIIQNLRLIKKYKPKFKVKGKNKYQSASLLLVLGLPTNMIKQALS